jgi:hypothetical protein
MCCMQKLAEVQKAKDLMHEALTERLRTCVDRRHVSGTAREPYAIATFNILSSV